MIISNENVGSLAECVPSQDDSSSSLDVVVEDLLVLVPLEICEGLLGLEVLELYNHIRIYVGHGLHELIHEFTCLLYRDTLLTETKI